MWAEEGRSLAMSSRECQQPERDIPITEDRTREGVGGGRRTGSRKGTGARPWSAPGAARQLWALLVLRAAPGGAGDRLGRVGGEVGRSRLVADHPVAALLAVLLLPDGQRVL